MFGGTPAFLPLGIEGFHYCNQTPQNDRYHFLHTHEDLYELHLHLNGRSVFDVEGRLFPMFFGGAVLTKPGESHGVRIQQDCLYERAHFWIPVTALSSIDPSLTRCFGDRPFGQKNYVLLTPGAASHCAAELVRIDALRGKPELASVGFASLLAILSEVSCASAETARLAERGSELVTEAIRLIDEKVESIRSVEDLADRLFVSRVHLSRVFSRQMETTLSRYLTNRRVERAKELLRSGASVTEACFSSGFSNISYFIRVFKSSTGVTPHRYSEN